LQSFLPNIEEKANAKLDAIDREIKRSVDTIVKQTRSSFKEDLQGDLNSTFKKWGGGILAGFAISCAAVWLMISSYLPRLSEYAKFDELARRAAMAQQAETITGLNAQLQTQAGEIEFLKKELDDLKTGNNDP